LLKHINPLQLLPLIRKKSSLYSSVTTPAKTKDGQLNHSTMNNPDDSVAAASDHRQSALLDRILLHLYQAVSATYLLDLAVVCYRLIQGQPPQSSSDTLSMASAKVAAWI